MNLAQRFIAGRAGSTIDGVPLGTTESGIIEHDKLRGRQSAQSSLRDSQYIYRTLTHR